MEILNASKEHAPDLAYLINLAGEGMPEYLWRQLCEENTRAKTLYEHLGYAFLSSLPVLKYPGWLHSGEWLLITRSVI